MSTRAYRINYIDVAEQATFNVSRNHELGGFLSLEPVETIHSTTTDIAEAYIEDAIRTKTAMTTVAELDQLREDIDYANQYQNGQMYYDLW